MPVLVTGIRAFFVPRGHSDQSLHHIAQRRRVDSSAAQLYCYFTMTIRRLLVALIVLGVTSGLLWLLCQVLAPGGWTIAKLAMLVGLLGTAPWTGLCLANGVLGFLVLLTTRAPSREVPAGTPPPLAIAVTVRDEDLPPILRRLGELLDGLASSAPDWAVTAFLLSDTADPTSVAAEARALTALSDADRARIRYRRRADNTGFKAGNIMAFLDHHATGFELMLVLDADSTMSPAAVLRLGHAMQADPRLGIVQHLTVGLPATSPFPRLFQFGMRAGMRIWAAGQDWWQGDEGPYWGHNAMIRIAPFRAHARLPLLPDGRHILSHDQVEAALLRGAGWGVRVLPDEDGSFELFPPALPEHLHRELRWLAGNLQYTHLLRLKNIRPLGRWQFVQAILLFAGTPFCVLFLVAAAIAAATDPTSAFPAAPALALTLAWSGALYAPKLLGYLEVLLSHTKRNRYGGATPFLVGVLAETIFTLTYDAIGPVNKTMAMARLLLGARPGWLPQNRSARGVSWREAARLFWPHTLLGIAVFAAFTSASIRAALWALPFAGGLLVAIPFAVVSANQHLGRWLRQHGVAAIPEEFQSGVAAFRPYTSPARRGRGR
jgi:membrane glycosyltransferase